MDKQYRILKNRYKNLGLKSFFYFWARWRLASIEKIEKYVSKEGKILDFGCGSGILANYLALTSENRSVIGFDIWKKKINEANKIKGEVKNIFFTKNLEDIKQNYKAIVMSDVIHHLSKDEQEKTLEELKNLLESDGVLIIEDIDKGIFPNYLVGWFVDVITSGRKNIFYRKKEEIISMLEKLNFKVECKKLDMIAHILFVGKIK